MILEQLYRKYSSEGGSARDLLNQTHWYSSIAVFDPRTHEAFPQPLSILLRKIAEQEKLSQTDNSWVLKDRLWRIIVHARDSLTTLLRNLNESPFRDHAVLPLRAVRELDTSSFMALSRRPGRNVREKLSGKPYLQAVRRYQSVDLPENGLLKAFAERLAELLELRVELLNDQESKELLYHIRFWLTTDEAKSIRRWENLPPNNTLLSHKDYRHIYDSWRWLQSLDDDLEADMKNFSARQKTMQEWREYGSKYAKSTFLFAEAPVLFDYDKFEIRPWDDQLRIQKTIPFFRPKDIKSFDAPVCIDLAEMHPRYAFLMGTEASPCEEFPNPFIWQRWENEDSPVHSFDIDLFSADAVYLHSDATTISAPDLFFSKNHTVDRLDYAARTFTKKLRETFKNDVLFWLQPDYLNDFELKITRSNINAYFPKAEPLPRSVAAVIEKVDYQSIKDGYIVLVTDTIGGKLYVTKLEAKFDPELYDRLPDTYGFYWERHPSIIIPNTNAYNNSQIIYDMYLVDESQRWPRPQKPYINSFIDDKIIQDNSIGHFDRIINITNSPVCGGVKLYAMQQRAGNTPIWRDQIPVLSIEIPDEHYWSIQRRLYLVDKKTPPIKPIRGQAVTIPIELERGFTLPAGNSFYQFPLYIGDNDDEIGYSARLESSSFPLKNDLICDLKMQFTYGVDDPYSLVFIPRNNNIPPIRVKWEKTVEEEKEVINDPVPDYPVPMSWEELRRVPKRGRDETEDLFKQAQVSIKMLNNRLHPPKRVIGSIIDDWRPDINGKYITFARCPDINGRILIHQDYFINNCDFSDFYKYNEVSFHLNNRYGKYSASKIANPEYRDPEYQEPNIIKAIHKYFYRPMIQIWCDGRSINDDSCPPDYKNSMNFIINSLRRIIQKDDVSRTIKNEIMFLLSCSHKDAPDECIQWINEQIAKEEMSNYRAVGFALGDVSQPWQKNILNKLKENGVLSYSSLRVLSYAIWHEQHFIEQLSYSDCQEILNGIMKMLANIKPCPKRIDKRSDWYIRNWVRTTTEPLELLLGMLRTRNSSNEEIRTLLQTPQNITKELIKQVEHVTRIVAESNEKLPSRVQLGNLPQKPEGDHTPDLLYALLLFLRGNSLANTIRITGVSDTDSDDD